MTQADRVLSTPPTNTPIAQGQHSALGAVSACPALLILDSLPSAAQTLAGECEPQAALPACSAGVGAQMSRRTIMNMLVSAAAAAASSTVMPSELQASDQALVAVADLAMSGEPAKPQARPEIGEYPPEIFGKLPDGFVLEKQSIEMLCFSLRPRRTAPGFAGITPWSHSDTRETQPWTSR